MTVDSHAAGQRCQCCADDGCDQLDWARWELGKHRAARAQTIPPQRPAAPDGRRSKEHNMSSTKWRTLRCDNSGPNCPQIMESDGMVHLRDSERPEDIVSFTPEAFETLKRYIRDGEV